MIRRGRARRGEEGEGREGTVTGPQPGPREAGHGTKQDSRR